MNIDELFQELKSEFETRKFAAGLLVAFIDFLQALKVSDAGYKSFDDFLAAHPRKLFTNTGKKANTLIVSTSENKTLSLRPYYNAIERYFRVGHKRFDYPSCAPHATQVWVDYTSWLNALITYSVEDLFSLREMVCEYVLQELKSQAFDPSDVRVDPPLFQLLLEEFDFTAKKGEPTGAAFQGTIFGFLRADNAHLQVEISKVRTGSKRLQRDCTTLGSDQTKNSN